MVAMPGKRVRYRWSCQVLYGRFGEFFDLQEEKHRIAEARGWTRPTFWVTTAGRLNDFFLEREYETLDELTSELAAREADFEFMKAMRDSYRLVVQGSVKIEIFEEASAP